MATFEFMKSLESRYRIATGLANRSQYKLFYGPVVQAPILTLGINPGGDPLKTSSDGVTHDDGTISTASATYYENGEHDVLDCKWKENSGLLKILDPLVDFDHERLRREVIKTNLAFRRSKSKKDIDIKLAIEESAPFLDEIIGVVKPKLILLTGVAIDEFTKIHASNPQILAEEERDPGVKQVVFSAANARLNATQDDVLIVRVAHASQFSWTYDRYNVVKRIKQLCGTLQGSAVEASKAGDAER